MTRKEYIEGLTAVMTRTRLYAPTGCVLHEREQRLLALGDCDARLEALGKLLPGCRTSRERRRLVLQIDVWLDHRLTLLTQTGGT